jgi:creatinine amidohydrolase
MPAPCLGWSYGITGAALALSAAASVLPAQERAPFPQRLAELTWVELRDLDRSRAVVLLPLGVVEEHGPHLPVAIDTYIAEALAADVARRLVIARPGITVLLAPTLAFGAGGANEFADQGAHPGTYGLRPSTLRAGLADLGAALARNGFGSIFVINFHAVPRHLVAIADATDFVAESFGVTMLSPVDLSWADSASRARGTAARRRALSPAALARAGTDIHAGVDETSRALAVARALVRSSYRTLPDRRAATFPELEAIAQRPGWEGYWSAPALATPALGRDLQAVTAANATGIILRALAGEDLTELRRAARGDGSSPPTDPLDDDLTARLDQWLARRRAPGSRQ